MTKATLIRTASLAALIVMIGFSHAAPDEQAQALGEGGNLRAVHCGGVRPTPAVMVGRGLGWRGRASAVQQRQQFGAVVADRLPVGIGQGVSRCNPDAAANGQAQA